MRPSPFSRACDECRRRKVRCDAGSPCSNCRIAHLTCTFRVAPRKRGRKPRLDGRRLSCERCSPPAASLPPMELARERTVSPRVDASPLLSSASSPSYLGRSQDQQQLASPTVGVGVGSPFSVTAVGPSYRSDPRHSLQSDQEHQSSSSGIALYSHPGDASRIHRNLLLEVSGILREADFHSGPSPASLDVEADLEAVLDTVLRIMHKCIDLFVQYFFPNTPIAHEPSLRRAVSDFASGLPLVLTADAAPGDRVFSMRSFTLITALCAFITSVVPDVAVPHSISLTWPFYRASRSMSHLYEELDLESPVSASYTSRIWQSAALQNVTGKNFVAWHVSGEVTIMALRTRLYDEETVSNQAVGKLDSQLLRANFWLVYLTDRTATAFEGRPSVMSDVLSQGLLTLHERGPYSEPLLDPSNPLNVQSLEEFLMQGFHLKTRLWASAADFMHHLNFLTSPKQRQQQTTTPMQSLLEKPDWTKLSDLHQTFLGVLDDLPTCLRSPNAIINKGAGDDPIGTYQAQSFWALRNNIFSVYHCMRLVMLHECVLQGIPEILGLENKAKSLVLRKLEIVQDFLLEMQLAPFMCLKVQGEAAIQRIRRVGCILLEMVNHAINDTLHKRAISQFNQILDVLTSLDSKATATELGAGVLPAVMNNVEQ